MEDPGIQKPHEAMRQASINREIISLRWSVVIKEFEPLNRTNIGDFCEACFLTSSFLSAGNPQQEATITFRKFNEESGVFLF